MHSDSPPRRSHPNEFEHITSTGNDLVKLMRSLERKRSRKEAGLFIAEGARHAEEALHYGWEPVSALTSQAMLERESAKPLLRRLAEQGARVVTTNERVLGAIARKDNPQTLITAFRQRSAALDDLKVDGARRWVALYEVRDPGNLGTILRTADATGVDGVILIGTCCDPFSPETVRASMGSVFAVPFIETSTESFWAWVGASDAQVTAASMRGAVSTEAHSYSERAVILMGNEQAGLPEAMEARCDQLVRLPMQGRADSLNLACASAVMMYDVWRAVGYKGASS